ncbi:cobaltochelatase subunit CobN [Anaerobaca lacustris]|uniref:Cobaltochelatase subunit CobN n=1 Tax=Anaerobaca lacustris TaxID=3044600 RepID=A0AAW6TT89_9BACT|nr:cobaltochelatase subunit CobN [Sedimentisphaerales bacterium M17dextr]
MITVNKRRVGVLAAIVILLIAGAMLWHRFGSRTRIAVINFPDAQYGQLLDAAEGSHIRLDRIKAADLPDAKLSSYALTLIFGMGLRLDDAQAEKVRQSMARGAAVYVHASTSADNEFSNVMGKDLEHIEAYLENGGPKNLRHLFAYVRRAMDGKSLFAGPIEEAQEIPMDTLFHLGQDDYFTDVNAYQDYYQTTGRYREGRPHICLLTALIGPRTSRRGLLDVLIRRLEALDLNVYPIAGFRNRLSYMREIAPDLVVYFPHGRVQMMGQADAVVAWLRERNIPLLCPINVMEPYDEWLNGQQGMVGGLLSQSVVMPELDGGVEPFVVSAQFPDERGLLASRPIPERMNTFVRRIQKWLALRSKPNAEKRVAIVYFKGPGRNAMVASGMEVPASLLNVLRHLRDNGYATGLLPETVAEFEAMIQRQGPVLGPYAQGAFDDFVREGDPELIRTEDYLAWVQEQLPSELYTQVEASYGAAPGQYLSLSQDGQTYLALPRVRFGNIVILPQLMPGIGDDTNKLVHGVKAAPPHPYIATYLWARHGFGADALVHFGTHGSLEFTPWKQSALSQMDWSDALTGDLPHPYIYTINNIGEAVVAKRRSYATLVSHLTPPFMASDLYGPLAALADAVHGYLNTPDDALRAEYAQDIRAGVKELDLDKDLEFEDFVDRPLDRAEIDALHHYLRSLAIEKVTRGNYVLGRPYEEAFARETAGLMALEPVTYALVRLDEARGGAHADRGDHVAATDQEAQTHPHAHHAVDEVLRPYAAQIIEEILSGQASWQDYVSDADLARLTAWDEARQMKSSGPPHSRDCGCPACRAWVAAHAQQEKGQPSETVEDADEAAVQRRLWVARACRPPHREVLFQTADMESFRAAVETWELDRTLEVKSMLSFYAEHTDLAEEVGEQPGKDNIALAALLRLGRAPIERALKVVDGHRADLQENERTYVQAVRTLRDALQEVNHYQASLLASTDAELDSLVRVLAGGYVAPSPGGDALRSPKAIPTGRNLTAIDMDKTPTPQSWRVGVQLAESTLQKRLDETGQYPKKVAVTLWGGELIRTEGAQIAMIFHFLGVEPVRNARGTVHAVQLVPMEKLQRPRIDVVVQTSGQARDIAVSRLFLIEEAVKLASNADDPQEFPNRVKEGTLAAEAVMKDKGLSPLDARTFATARVFGGVNGNYGTGIMGLVESGDRWEEDTELTDQYLKNMGAMYTKDHWGHYQPGVFTAALQNTDTVVQSRSSNQSGPLSLDHVYEFMGGINAVIRNVTGEEPDAMFSDLRNPNNPKVQGAKEAIWTESRTTLMNPKYIKAMQAEGSSAAESFAETFRNTYAWNVLKPVAIDNELWEGLYDVYVRDSLGLDMKAYFKEKNPYALQEMSAVMLETIRKGYWPADAEVVKTLAELHVELVKDHEPGCSTFVCDNAKLRDVIAQNVAAEVAQTYRQQIEQVRVGRSAQAVDGMTLTQQTMTLDAIKNAVSQSLPTILMLLALVGLFIAAVFLGVRRHGN